jgi:hypothetical protein
MSITKLKIPERLSFADAMSEAFDILEEERRRMRKLDSIKRFELPANLLPTFNKIVRTGEIDGSGYNNLDYAKTLLEAVSSDIEANADCTADVYRTIDKINAVVETLDEITTGQENT